MDKLSMKLNFRHCGGLTCTQRTKSEFLHYFPAQKMMTDYNYKTVQVVKHCQDIRWSAIMQALDPANDDSEAAISD